MRLEETGLRITEDAVLAHNAAGEVLSEYPREKTPLFKLYQSALKKRLEGEMDAYDAGVKFAELYRMSGLDPWQGITSSDPSRIHVDGSGMAPELIGGSDRAKLTLERIEAFLGPSYAICVGICAQEMTLERYGVTYRMDWRSVKKRLKASLSRLSEWFRKN